MQKMMGLWPALCARVCKGNINAVDVVEDGEQARSMGSEFDYDLVILDLNLPNLDGVSVLRHLRLKRSKAPNWKRSERCESERYPCDLRCARATELVRLLITRHRKGGRRTAV